MMPVARKVYMIQNDFCGTFKPPTQQPDPVCRNDPFPGVYSSLAWFKDREAVTFPALGLMASIVSIDWLLAEWYKKSIDCCTLGFRKQTLKHQITWSSFEGRLSVSGYMLKAT